MPFCPNCGSYVSPGTNICSCGTTFGYRSGPEEVENNVDTKIENIKRDLLSELSPNEPNIDIIRESFKNYIDQNEDSLTIYNKEYHILVELATNLALKHPPIYDNGNGVREIFLKAKIELKSDENLRRELTENIDFDIELHGQAGKLWTYVYDYAKENDLLDALGKGDPGEKLLYYLIKNRDKYADCEPNEETALNILKEAMYFDPPLVFNLNTN